MTNQEALDALHLLLRHLDKENATTVATGIRNAVAAGIVRKEADSRRRTSTRSSQLHHKSEDARVQEELLPAEALVVAARLIAAAVEPVLMMSEARATFATFLKPQPGQTPQIGWENDRLIGAELEAAVEVSREEVMPIPTLEAKDLSAIKSAAMQVVKLCDELVGDVA